MAITSNENSVRYPTLGLDQLQKAHSGYTQNEDFDPYAPPSPLSPVGNCIREMMKLQPPVAQVHRVSLKGWSESHDEQEKIVHRRIPSKLSDFGQTPKTSASTPDLSTITPLRALTREEVQRKGRDAKEWFRESRSINRNIRSIEDTETILAKARERRANSVGATTRRKSKELPLGEPNFSMPEPPKPKAGMSKMAAAIDKAMSKDEVSKVEKALALWQTKPRTPIDPMALWGAKPKAAPEKPAEAPRRSSCMREGVKVGDSGENSLRARLQRAAQRAILERRSQTIN